MQSEPSGLVPPEILEEAADWIVRLQSEPDFPGRMAELDHWRARSPVHALAWQRAEAVLGSFQQVPPVLGRQTLKRLSTLERRRVLHVLGLLMAGVPTILWLGRERPLAPLMADLRTATGEQRTVVLPDGARLVLNTSSAVNVRFDAQARLLDVLRGEILIDTAADVQAPARPFIVRSAQGDMHPVGTRFSVRQLEGVTRLAVFAGAVDVHTTHGPVRQVEAGRELSFGAPGRDGWAEVGDGDAAWAEGMLLARDMRLVDWAAELSRYRPGVIRVSPQVAELRVSGAFPLVDTDAALTLLLRTRPLRLRSVTRYWVSLEPAPGGR